MSDAPILLTEQDGHVAIVRINRPKVLNALNLELMEQLAELLEQWDADDGIRVIVLSGNDRAFAAVTGFVLPHCPFFAPKALFDYYFERVSVPAEECPPDEPQTPAVRRWRANRGMSVPLTPHQIRVARAAYLGLCEHLDAQIGTIMDTLEATGLAKNTLVIYTSVRHALRCKPASLAPQQSVVLNYQLDLELLVSARNGMAHSESASRRRTGPRRGRRGAARRVVEVQLVRAGLRHPLHRALARRDRPWPH